MLKQDNRSVTREKSGGPHGTPNFAIALLQTSTLKWMARFDLQWAQQLTYSRTVAKRSGILKQGRHVLIVTNIPLHSQCYSAEQKSKVRLMLIMREVKFLIDACPTALFSISLQKFQPPYVGCRAFLKVRLRTNTTYYTCTTFPNSHWACQTQDRH